MSSEETIHEVKIRCPNPECRKEIVVKVPKSAFDKSTTGIVSLSINQCCGEPCHVFIDKNLKQRGGQCADMVVGEEEVELIPREAFQMAELVTRYATELIKITTLNENSLRDIGAEIRINTVEVALINGDIRTAGFILGDLKEFTDQIGEELISEVLSQTIVKINTLLINKVGFDWDSIVITDDPEDTPRIRQKKQALREERLRKIIAELEFEALEGNLPEPLVKSKIEKLKQLCSPVTPMAGE